MTEDSKQKLHVIFTMDCVPPEGPDAVAGPDSWEDARESVSSFSERLQDLGMRGTFFLEPSVFPRMEQQADALLEAGMETAILCHPQLHEYQSCLGSYSFDRQREIVHLVSRIWENARSTRSRTFRPGFFSTNDYTYQVLCMEGYAQGSCSLPGRIDMDQCCEWKRAFPFPHHTDPLDRKLAGTMEFFEVPVNSDFQARPKPGAEMYTPPHLRIESPCINEHAEELIRHTLERMDEEGTPLRSLTFVTHNAVNWGAPEDPHCARLSNLVQLVQESCEDWGLDLTPSTLKDFHEYADDISGNNQPMGRFE